MKRYSIAVFLLIGAALAAFINPLLLLVFAGLFLAVFFLARNLEFGLLLLVFLFPYLGIVIDFSTVSALREIPYIRAINAPFVDLYGMVFFLAWMLSFVARPHFVRGLATNVRQLPHFKSYLLFLSSAVVSLANVPSYALGASVKYIARPILFFYLVFFAPTISIIRRGGEKFLMRVFGTMYATGMLCALIGLVSFFVVPFDTFPRATSFALLGLASWGPNHNLLAETLIATAPAGLILSSQLSVHSSRYRWLRYGMFFQYVIALLTFSRTAWIAIAVQIAVFLMLQYRGHVNAFLRRMFPAFVAIIPFALYLIWSMTTSAVQGSNSTRLDLIRIAWFYFVRHPWIGNGIGTFIPTLGGVEAFMVEYGKVLEAHGIVWKLLFEQGILGLVTFGIFMGAILVGIYKSYRTNKTYPALVAILIAVGIVSYELFNTTYYTLKLWVPLGIAVAVSRITERMQANKERIRSD